MGLSRRDPLRPKTPPQYHAVDTSRSAPRDLTNLLLLDVLEQSLALGQSMLPRRDVPIYHVQPQRDVPRNSG